MLVSELTTTTTDSAHADVNAHAWRHAHRHARTLTHGPAAVLIDTLAASSAHTQTDSHTGTTGRVRQPAVEQTHTADTQQQQSASWN